MLINKYIFIIAFLSFTMIAPATPAGSALAAQMPAGRPEIINTFELIRESIVVAENEPPAAEKGSPSTTENKDQAPGSGPADREKSGNDSNDAETKPLKPFKPSEEIAAEQAVDYPVDI